jgi:hypothetical protein
MSPNDRNRAPNQKGSVPPELKDADLRWDDDGAPSPLELDLGDNDDAFDRVTAIPDIPNEILARRLMERSDAETASRARRDRGSQVPTAPPVAEGAHGLYEADHEEQTVKVDAERLQQRVARMSSDPGPILSFEFTPESDLPPAEDDLSMPGRDSVQLNRDSDLPPALGGAFRQQRPSAPRLTPAASAEQVRREPSVPRTRMPTVELVLELDTLNGPQSALELAENAPVVDRPSDPNLEFEMPTAQSTWEPQSPRSEHADMKDRYAMGDFTGALVIAEGILESNSHDNEAHLCAEHCRDVLTQMYSARLGPLSQTVAVAIPNDEIRWLSLDHRAGFLLSLVDGSLTLEEILDISGMPKLDALRLMFTLFDQHVVRLK